MNIFDMPFLAATFFPTKSVENGGARAEKIGKSYGEEDSRVSEERRRFRREAGRSREEREKGDEGGA